MRKLVQKNVKKWKEGFRGPGWSCSCSWFAVHSVRNKAKVVQFSCVADSRRQHFVMSCRPGSESEGSTGGQRRVSAVSGQRLPLGRHVVSATLTW